jgi:hypothetical protein
MSEGSNPMLSYGVPEPLPGVLVSLPGVLKGLPGVLLAGFVILLFVRIRGSAMSMSRNLVQLGGSLMILVM